MFMNSGLPSEQLKQCSSQLRQFFSRALMTFSLGFDFSFISVEFSLAILGIILFLSLL